MGDPLIDRTNTEHGIYLFKTDFQFPQICPFLWLIRVNTRTGMCASDAVL